MFAVIFTARIKSFDDDYSTTAQRLRDLALTEFGCREFTAVTEGDQEIAVSTWDTREQIAAWKQHPAHQEAQRNGRERWYHSYDVKVVAIEREYAHGKPK